MNSPCRSLSFVVFAASLGLAGYACGGKTAGTGGGSSSSGGGSSGGGSSGGGSSGGASGSGGSSSGGGSSGSPYTCPNTPGAGTCASGETCNYGEGCSLETCSCDANGGWICGGSDCTPPPCPAAVPNGVCPDDALGQTCSYSDPQGCGPSCTCVNDGIGPAWACSYPPCASSPCPAGPPGAGSTCSSPGLYCYYPDDGGCYGATGICESDGTWTVNVGGFCDAGFEGD
ncbi:MAG TPA: hypothetical protein VGG39_19085 [Polyangiaceae bacterium]